MNNRIRVFLPALALCLAVSASAGAQTPAPAATPITAPEPAAPPAPAAITAADIKSVAGPSADAGMPGGIITLQFFYMRWLPPATRLRR